MKMFICNLSLFCISMAQVVEVLRRLRQELPFHTCHGCWCPGDARSTVYTILIVLTMLSRNNSYHDYIPSSMYVICLFYLTLSLDYALYIGLFWPISCISLSVCKCCIYVCSDQFRIFYYVSVLHVVYRFVLTDVVYFTMCQYCILYIGLFWPISNILLWVCITWFI